jgi:twinkle protein
LDHLSIIVSDQQQGDERKALDEIMTKLKTLTMELDIALIAVVHTNRNGQIRGTAGIEQLANIIIELERDVKSTDEDMRRTLTGLVSKNRFSGKTGPAFAARYHDDTGRLVEPDYDNQEISSEDLTKFFGGGTLSSDGREEAVYA